MTKVLRIAELRSRATAFVLEQTGVSYTDLISPRRQAHLIAARALFVWIVKTYGPEFLSSPTIGKWLGGRDHTTILHAWTKTVPLLRERDPDFLLLCDQFTAQLADEMEVSQCQ